MSSIASYDHQSGRGVRAFFADLAAGLSMVDLWRTFAWDEIQQRYRRSALGVLWIVVSFGIFVTGISLFFSAFAQAEPMHFVLYVAVGFAAYSFISGNIVDGCQVFTGSSTWIKSLALPYSVHVYRSMFRSLFTFGLQMLIVAAILVYSGWRPNLLTLMALPAFAVFLFTAIPLQYFFGLVAARFRDVDHLVSSLTRLMIFVTPIIWVREDLTGLRATVADFNPLTHYIEIFRNPILGTEPRMMSWIIVLCLTVAVWAAAAVSAALMRRRLPYWI